MKKFEAKKILTPIDFSETSMLAIEHATQIAKKFQAELHLIHVIKTTSYIPAFPEVYEEGSGKVNTKDIVSAKLDEIAKNINHKHGITVNTEISQGGVSREIVGIAKDIDVDLIVMGTHGASGFEEFFIGSNAYRVVTASTCPVLVTQSEAKPEGYDKIVMPIDSSQHTRDKVSHTARFAKEFGATVHIMTCITKEHEDEKKIFDMKVKQVREFFDKNDVKYEEVVKNGENLADMVLDYAKEIDTDLIMIMTEQEPSTGLFVGPYAQQIVNHSKFPVMTVTPIAHIDRFDQSDLIGEYRMT